MNPTAAELSRINGRKSRSLTAQAQKRIFLIVALTPALGGYALFTLYPNLLSIVYSLLDWNGISEPRFVGLQNFKSLLHDPYVWRALKHNLFFAITVPVSVIAISLVLAYILTNKGYRGSGLFKVLFFFPNVLSSVIVALLWTFIYDGNFGILNALLRLFGADIGHYYWLGEESTAIWAIVPPSVWGGVGFYVVIIINAMTSIPPSLYESAKLDGASHTTRLFRITLPLIMPIIRVCALFLMLGTLKGFEQVLILTNGGPSGSTEVIGLYMFNMAFGTDFHNYGYASAVGMLLFVILVGAKLIMDKALPNRSYEY